MKKIDNNTYLLVLKKGDNVVDKLKEFHKEVDYKLCKVEGIGALEKVNMSYAHVTENGVNYEKRDFNDDYELLSFNGNLSTFNDETIVHIHIAISDDKFLTYGGHLNSAVVAVTLELFITVYDVNISRSYDEETALNLIK